MPAASKAAFSPASQRLAPNLKLESCQECFQRRWGHLHDPHVRALAWLLDAPDLLDPQALQWQHKIATLRVDRIVTTAWLEALDAAPAALYVHLNVQGMTRLGRYAEKLMAYYFCWRGNLVAHGLQVQAARTDTVGEFDFLLRDGPALLHWEFATKFYLFENPGTSPAADYFVGPNLADTLSAKMHKILDRQLALSRHPAAQAYLSQAVLQAQALIKGWLFYRDASLQPPAGLGLATAHCRGFWCTLGEFDAIAADGFVVLPRMAWLAPARLPIAQMMDHQRMVQDLEQHFAKDSMPVMLALVRTDGAAAVEYSRGFVVPDDWRLRAGQRQQREVLGVPG